MIGPYKLLQAIGEGGMGTVFMAEQAQPVQRKVALKIIKPGMDTRQVIARFEAERQALALMDHPNIAKVLDAGTTEGGRPYFVMELVKGVPMTRYCDEHRLTPKQRLELFVPVCQAVQHAHQKGVIHRDLKPSNVLVAEYDDQPVAKVIDFGVAKATGPKLTERTLFTEFGQVVGTLEYMSPEQAKLNALDIDTRSDIYALGVLLYELLTGTTPFDKKRLHQAAFDEMLRIIREEEPPKPSTRLSTTAELPSIAANRGLEPKKLSRLVRGELDWIVMKALDKDRNRRYETANGLARDLERYLEDEPVQACPPSAAYRLRKFLRRNKRALATATLMSVMVLALATVLGWTARDRAARQAALEHEVERALEETEMSYQRGKLPEAMAAVKRAEGLLASGAGSAELQRRMGQWRTDLEMVTRLDTIRLEKAEAKGENFGYQRADLAYGEAFRWYGLDVEALDADAAAEHIRAAAIRDRLVAGLDDWGRSKTGEAAPAGKERLVAVSQRADPDPWRNRLRDAYLRSDPKAVAELARDKEVLALPPDTVSLLASVLGWRSSDQLLLAVEVLQRAQRRHPSDFWINYQLAIFLLSLNPPRAQDAICFLQVALALRPENPIVMHELGLALLRVGRPAEAEAELRDVVRQHTHFARAHLNLGLALRRQGKLAEGEAEYREAIRLEPNYPMAHRNLGVALRERGDLLGAEAVFRDAVRVSPDRTGEHTDRGNRLLKEGKVAWAEAAFREARRLNPDYRDGCVLLADVLVKQGKLAEAEGVILEAVRRKPEDPVARYHLGNALRTQKKLDEAIAAYQKAIALDPEYAEAHCNLGHTLREMRRFAEALTELKKGHELGSKRPDWSYPSAGWVTTCQRLIQLDARLSAIRKGEQKPTDANEQVQLALDCLMTRLPATAARFYREVLTAQPQLNGHFFNAARAAALAGCGQGEDVAPLDDQERAHWRKQALAWLRADLEVRREGLESGPPKAPQAVQAALESSKDHPDFAGVRDRAALTRLPATEREAWQKFWADVEALLRQAREAQQPK
jgi:tetratricopeptide (TPR) repeat protein